MCLLYQAALCPKGFDDVHQIIKTTPATSYRPYQTHKKGSKAQCAGSEEVLGRSLKGHDTLETL